MTTLATVFTSLIAQTSGTPTTAPAGGAQGLGLFAGPMPLILAFLVIFMFFSFSSKRKQDKQRQAVLSSMKRGDRVQTIGGILGTIVEVRDLDVVVKVDESNNTKIKFARSAVTKVVTDDDKVEAR